MERDNFKERKCISYESIVGETSIYESLRCVICLELVYPLVTCSGCKNIFGEFCI
jgi:hypothetical protein